MRLGIQRLYAAHEALDLGIPEDGCEGSSTYAGVARGASRFLWTRSGSTKSTSGSTESDAPGLSTSGLKTGLFTGLLPHTLGYKPLILLH